MATQQASQFESFSDKDLLSLVETGTSMTKNLDFYQLMQLRDELKRRGLHGYKKTI